MKDYLQAVLNRCRTLEEWNAAAVLNLVQRNAGSFGKLKEDGIGARTLTAFLGERWRNRVIAALQLLAAERATLKFKGGLNAGHFTRTKKLVPLNLTAQNPKSFAKLRAQGVGHVGGVGKGRPLKFKGAQRGHIRHAQVKESRPRRAPPSWASAGATG